MSQKRKLEEFHDPDYPQSSDNKRKCTASFQPEERNEKIRAIIRREFESELSMKEKDVMDIDNRLVLAKKLLHKVRYVVVGDYYSKQTLDVSASELNVGNTYTNLLEKDKRVQKPIHPALRSLLGKKHVDYDEILKIRPPREAAKTAKSSIKEKLMTKKEEKRLQRELNGTLQKQQENNSAGLGDSKKVPRHIDPFKIDKPVPQLNSSRFRRNQTKHLIVVGNTSKFIGDEKASDRVTHKWLIYVQTKTALPIENIVKKVRFFLHPSYRPNDIVDVSSPPFQLSRRGWGEFPVRLQLFFDPKLQQKPVQLVHNLVLDKTLSGIQTRGAETLVEIWLSTDYLSPLCTTDTTSKLIETVSTENSEKTNLSIPELDHFEDNLLAFLNKIEKQNPTISQESDDIEPTITCSPIIDKGIISPNTRIISSPAKSVKIVNNSPNIIIKNSSHVLEKNISQSGCAKVRKEFNSEIETGQIVQDSVQNDTPPSQETSTIPLVNTPKIFQKKLVKCIDKQGNVKYISMLVSANANFSGQPVQQNNQLPGKQKTFIITKLNGQNNSINVKPQNALNLISTSASKLLTTTQKDGPIKLPQDQAENKGFLNNNNNNNNKIKQDVSKLDLPKLEESNQIAVNLPNIPTAEQSLERTTNNRLSFQPTMHIDPKLQQLNKTLSSMASSQKNSQHLGKNHVFMKDGKMFIIDPLQSKIKQQSKKQESLLKPKISLLKPIVKNDNLANCIRNNSSQVFNHTALATDHDYTTLVANKSTASNTVIINRPMSLMSQMSTVVNASSPNNNPMSMFVTQTKSPSMFGTKSTSMKNPLIIQKLKKNYAQELEDNFLKMHFVGIRHATEYLLKQLPLINDLAMNSIYKMAFPFVVSSERVFSSLITPKQKCNEWLRAKHVSQLIKKHGDVKDMEPWTTREIILFARHHAYSPVITYSKDRVNNNLKMNNDTLKNLIKKEIKKEKLTHNTVTPAENVYAWIHSMQEKLKGGLDRTEEIIDIEHIDLEYDIQKRGSCKISPIKNFTNKYWLSTEGHLEKECSLVNEKCYEIGIRLQPEEIFPSVMHQSAQIVLAQALRSFIEELVRRSLCKKAEIETASSMVEPSLQLDDVKSAILGRPQFDFLTNRYLGTLKVKEEKDRSG